jgi:release factor glutamine methyltransferase
MLALARSFLERKGLGEARLEAELLVGHALGIDRLRLFMRLDQPLLPEEVDRARDLLVRRGRREPTAYIVGSREFYVRDFLVGPGVLVPRPETELIVDRAREIAKESGWEAPRILDVGTGSGCLAVTLALEIEGAEVVAVDLSEGALDWAKKNAEALGASVDFRLGEGLDVARAAAADGGPFHLVVSNPPYVEPRERDDLSPEVREHEPPLALYAPPDDPDFWVRSLAEAATGVLLQPGGRCLVELGHLQYERLRGARLAGSLEVTLHEDLAGIPRVAEFGY